MSGGGGGQTGSFLSGLVLVPGLFGLVNPVVVVGNSALMGRSQVVLYNLGGGLHAEAFKPN